MRAYSSTQNADGFYLRAVSKTMRLLTICGLIIVGLILFPDNSDQNVSAMSTSEFMGYLMGSVIHAFVVLSTYIFISLMVLLLPFFWVKAFLDSLTEQHRIHLWRKHLPDSQKERYLRLTANLEDFTSSSSDDKKTDEDIWEVVDSLYNFYNLVEIDKKLDEIETLVAVRKMSKELISTNRSW